MVLMPSPRLHSRSWRNVHTQAPLPARSFLPVSGSILHATRIALRSVTPRPRAVILVRGGVCACGATMPPRHPTSRRKTRQAPLTHCEPPWRAQFPVLQWECVIGNGESARPALPAGAEPSGSVAASRSQPASGRLALPAGRRRRPLPAASSGAKRRYWLLLSSIAFDILSRMSGWAAMNATFSALVVEGSAVSAFISPCFRI